MIMWVGSSCSWPHAIPTANSRISSARSTRSGFPRPDYEEAQRQRWGIDTTLLMESGRYKIAVALLDPLTRQDSYQTVAVGSESQEDD